MSDINKTFRHDLPAASFQSGLVSAQAVHPQPIRAKSGVRPGAPTEQGITLRFVLTALRRWWLIAAPLGLLLAGIAGGAMYFLFQPVYPAAAWFRIEERTPYLAYESKDEGRSRLFFQTQIETIRSPLVLGPVIKRPEIAQLPEIAREADKVAWLAKQIKVKAVGESELFQIIYASPDAKAAASIVNAVTEAYFKLRDQSDAERNQRVIDLLGQEMEKRSKEVLRLRDNLRSLAKEVTGMDPFAGKIESNGLQKHPLADVESRLISAQVERAILEARIKATEEELNPKKSEDDAPAKEESELSSPQEIALRDAMVGKMVEDSAEVQRQKAMISAKQSRLKEIEEKSAKGDEDPLYTQMVKEIANDEESLERMRNEMKPRGRHEAELSIIARRTEAGAVRLARRTDDLAKMRSDHEASRMMEQMLKERFDSQRKNVEQSSGDTMELSFKRDELARAEKVFELIAQRALQLQTERGAPARVTLMQAAEPPSVADPFPYSKMGLALLAALCLPSGVAVFWERLAGRVSDSLSFEQQSATAVLGEIAHLPTRTPVRSGSADDRMGYEIRLFEESIDSLRTSLSLSEDLSGMRILAITSAANHEGKTSVAAQLAVSFARATGQPLLLIDGDMRSPDVHNVFQVPLEPGLAAVLSGECSLEDAIVTTWSNHVHLLPAGRLGINPHKLLGNGAWKSLLAKIPASYRYIVIDTPPVLAASEALVLAKEADATLVCMMRDVSRMDQVRKAIERLSAAGNRPVGTVLNGVSTRHYASRYGSYGYAGK